MESVLIVDDEKDNLEALRRLLRQDFAVTVTESGLEALRMIQTQEFAAIVSDQRMPEISGVELLEKAKQIRPLMTRILLTGYTDIDLVIGAINRGSIYRYIAKPWDPADLKITLRQAVESFRLRKDLDEKNAALEASNALLRQLDRAKARFLALVSHELNTPLTSVAAFVALLSENHGFAPEIQKAVQSLAGASDRLGEIVQEVLSFVKLEADTQWQKHEFDWQKNTTALVQQAHARSNAKQIAVSVKGSTGVKSDCVVDKTLLALSKLLHEAIARSAKGGAVQVRYTQEPNSVLFQVEWKGDPLPAQAFDAFDPAVEEKNHHRNLALGLAIAKFIVEKQGGALVAEGDSSLKTAWLSARLPA